MFALMVYATLYHYMADGPFRPDYHMDYDSCSHLWWRNLLYINNLFEDQVDGEMVTDLLHIQLPLSFTCSLHPFHFQCFSWSWYLCVDWQLFLVAPIFIYALWR